MCGDSPRRLSAASRTTGGAGARTTPRQPGQGLSPSGGSSDVWGLSPAFYEREVGVCMGFVVEKSY